MQIDRHSKKIRFSIKLFWKILIAAEFASLVPLLIMGQNLVILFQSFALLPPAVSAENVKSHIATQKVFDDITLVVIKQKDNKPIL